MFFTLSDEFISKNIDLLLCQYGIYDNPLKFDKNFTPESFTAKEKRQNRKNLFFSEISFEVWIKNMLTEQINASEILISDSERNSALIVCYNNFIRLLDYSREKFQIYNQEVVDVLRRISYFTLYGNLNGTIDTAAGFNHLAHRLMPHVVDIARKENMTLEHLLRLSIVSGLSGLDLKGATAAASSHSNDGIPMKHLLHSSDEKQSAITYYNDLKKAFNTRKFPIFHYERFQNTVTSQYKALIVWFTDDIIESYFDLLFIERFLDEYKDLGVSVSLIAKNGRYGNDTSIDDIEMMCHTTFPSLANNKRFKIIKNGPLMAATNIDKFSPQMINECLSASLILLKGCRISEMINGGMAKPVFSAYSVVRTVSEKITGFSSESQTSLLYCLEAGEYAFWGTTDSTTIEKGRIISTVKDHFIDLHCDEAFASERMESLEKLLPVYQGNLRPLKNELELLKNILNR